MISKIKIIGLTAIAALAVSAVAATAVQANPQFHVESSPATLTGSKITPQVFTTEAGEVSCTNASFHGIGTALTTTSYTLSPSYSGCTAFGFLGSSIHMNECSYVFNLTTITASPYSTTVSIACPPQKMIEITGPFGCVVYIGPQNGIPRVSFTNNGSKNTRDLIGTFELVGLSHGTSSNCKTGEGVWFEGKIHGSFTLKADHSSGAQQGLWIA